MKRYRERVTPVTPTPVTPDVTPDKMLHPDVTPTSEGVTKKMLRPVTPVTPSVTPSVNHYPPLLYALADPVKRKKLVAICASLEHRGLLKEVRYGVYGPGFDVITEVLTAVK